MMEMNGAQHGTPKHAVAPLMTNEEGSFAWRTMTQRIPGIVQQTLEDNLQQLSEDQQRALLQLKEDIVHGRALPRPSSGSERSDCSWWQREWDVQTNHGQHGWLAVPWFFAEAYLYHVILDIVNFDTTQRDPFAVSKQKELGKASTWELLGASLQNISGEQGNTAVLLSEVLELCVWGNQADGCYQQVLQLHEEGGANSGLLIDERQKACDLFVRLKRSDSAVTVAVVTDNAGKELLMDLLLADWLLQFEYAAAVHFHVKAAPTFVSDATVEDVVETVNTIRRCGEANGNENIRQFGARLRAFIDGGQLVLSPHQFWNSCLHFHDMPLDLVQEVGSADVTIIKGDANYRRLLGDSVAWDPCTTMTEAAGFWPSPFLCLRTLKSDPIIGFSDAGQVRYLDTTFGYDWRVDGKRGLVQAGNFFSTNDDDDHDRLP